MPLSGKQRKQLLDALVSAFPNQPSLAHMVQAGLKVNLDTISLGPNLTQIVFELIDWAEKRDWIAALVAAARSMNPTDPLLRAFAEQLTPAPDASSPADVAKESSDGPAAEPEESAPAG